MKFEITTLADSYKDGHWNMLLPDSQISHSYWESRKGARFNFTIPLLTQYYCMEYLAGPVVTKENIEYGQWFTDNHIKPGVFNREGWEYILKEYDGHLPLEIKTVPEGTPIPTGNVITSTMNTDDKLAWLPNYVETLLSMAWGPSTVATLAREVKILCKYYLEQTGGDMGGLDFMLHCFGFRGVMCPEQAAVASAGQVASFLGTDTKVAIEMYLQYYGVKEMPSYSVLATEHMIMTQGGPKREAEIVKMLLDKNPTGPFAMVIDSYNFRDFISVIGKYNKKQILERDGKLVFRPDSGDPVATTLEVLERLGEVFGYTTNKKGFKVLNPKVGMLWGDGIDYYGIRNILRAMLEAGWCASNIIFGMGGGLLQKHDRDTQRFAYKCSAMLRDGTWYDVYKDPIDGTKTSKKGILHLYKGDEYPTGYQTTNILDPNKTDVLETVFKDGKMIKKYTLDDIRHNIRIA